MASERVLSYRLRATDGRCLEEVASDGQVVQPAANRAHALVALWRGETSATIGLAAGRSRMRLSYLWRRYEERSGDRYSAYLDAPSRSALIADLDCT